MEHGDPVAAAVHLNRVMELDPKNADPYKEMAEAAARRGEWAAALALLDRAIALDPYDLAARNSRGLALARMGRVDEARAEQACGSTRLDLERLTATRARLVDSPHDLKNQLQVARLAFRARPRTGGRLDEPGRSWPNGLTIPRPAGGSSATASGGARSDSPPCTACTRLSPRNRPPQGAWLPRETLREVRSMNRNPRVAKTGQHTQDGRTATRFRFRFCIRLTLAAAPLSLGSRSR